MMWEFVTEYVGFVYSFEECLYKKHQDNLNNIIKLLNYSEFVSLCEDGCHLVSKGKSPLKVVIDLRGTYFADVVYKIYKEVDLI